MKQWIIFSCFGILISYFLPWKITGPLSQSGFDLFLVGLRQSFWALLLVSGPLAAAAIAFLEFRQIKRTAINLTASVFCLFLGLFALDSYLPSYNLFADRHQQGIGSYLTMCFVLMLILGKLWRVVSRIAFFDKTRIPVLGDHKSFVLAGPGLALLLVGGWLFVDPGSETRPPEKATLPSQTQTMQSSETKAIEQSPASNDRKAESDNDEYTKELKEENRRLKEQLETTRQAEIKRQQELARKRICGGRTCIIREDGAVLFRTNNGRDWYFGDGIKVPEDEEPG